MKINPKIKTTFFQLSAILIVLATIIHSFDSLVAKYAMIVGVAGFALSTFSMRYPGKSLRGKRLFNIQILAVLFMAVAAFLMYIDYNGWVVLLFIAALQTLYCAIMLPKVYKQEQDEEKNNVN